MSDANKEALKEIGRWLVCSIVGWIFLQILLQLDAIPEFYSLKVWVLVFNIPIRLTIQGAVTIAGRYLDKWQHVTGKEEKTYPADEVPSLGWIKF